MTKEQFQHIASLNRRLEVLNSSIEKFEKMKMEEFELCQSASQYCADISGCPVYHTWRHPHKLSYVKLVIKDCNSREVELTPCEWHTLINLAIDYANAEKNTILKEIESL